MLGDAHKALVANRYLDKAFGEKKLELSPDADPVHTYFKEIVSYAPIAPAKLGYAAPANDSAKPKQKGLKP